MHRADRAQRPEILIAALSPSIALGLLNGLYGPPLAHTHPFW